MESKDKDFLFKEETHQIIGCAMEVLNVTGKRAFGKTV